MSDNTFHNNRKAITEQRMPLYQKLTKWMWRLAIGGVLAVIFLFVFLSFQDLPSFEDLENPKRTLATDVLASNGELLGRYYVENRAWVDYEDLSQNLVNALIATEDERYMRHSGIDGEAVGRVFVRTVLMGKRSSGGGSTITQQLARLLFTGRKASSLPKRAVQKLKEWITAVKLERSYTKEEIIAMYLNQF